MTMTRTFAPAGAAMLMCVVAASAQSLTTGEPNNGSGGVFLDLTAERGPLEITSFEVAYSGDAGTPVDVEVWVREGSYIGHTSSSTGWTLTQTITGIREGTADFSPLALDIPIQLAQGEVTGIYLQALDFGGIRYNGIAAEPPQTTWSDDNLTLFSEHSTTASAAFAGTVFTPRTFSGVVHYQPKPLLPLGTEVPLPPHDTTFSAASLTRGMWFTAPADFTITGLRVPDPTEHGLQNVEVVRLNSPPPIWSATTNDFISLYRSTAVPSEDILPVHIPVSEGEIIGILGAAGDSSEMNHSYGDPATETTILGRSATLHRLGMQFNLFSEPAQSLFTEASSIGRIEVYYRGPLGAEALATDPSNNGRSDDGAGVFFDLTPEQALSITGFEYETSSPAGQFAALEVWTRDGSYVNHISSSSGWSLHERINIISAGSAGALSMAPLSVPLELTANQTTGVYLVAPFGGIRYTGTATNPPQTTFADDNLSFSGEHARGGPPWQGTLFSPRTFSGAIHYTLGNQSFIIPDEFANTAGTTGRNTLLRDLPRRVQFVIAASELAQVDIGTPIAGIAWRLWDGVSQSWPQEEIRWDRYDIQVATSLNTPATFSQTFADNPGPDNIQVRSGPLTIRTDSFSTQGEPNPFGPSIPFTTPFIYQGGDLVFTIIHEGNNQDTEFLDSIGTSIPGYGTRFAYIDSADLGASTGSQGSFPVTQLLILGDEPECYANCDHSTQPPILNVDDFTCFINEFASAQSLPHAQQITHYANCDNSTQAPVLNVDDFTCFINAFAQGCP